jgi:hypothetical protein
MAEAPTRAPQTAGGRPATQPAPQQPAGGPAPAPRQVLQPADQTPAIAPEDRPLTFAIKVYVMSPDGFVCELTSSEQTRPAVFISQMCEGLAKLHFTPVDPFAAPNIDLDVAAPGAAAGAPAAGGGDAHLIPAADGAPPRCSLHGALQWREGTSGPQAKKPGEPYAFWSCKERSCKVKAGKSGQAQ